MSLVGCLREQAQLFPQRTFLVDRYGEWTYEETLELALIAGKRSGSVFHELNAKPVFFYARDSAAIVIGLCAAELAGLTACVLNRQDDPERVLDTVDGLRVDGLRIDALGGGYLFSDHAQHAALLTGALWQENVENINEILLARERGWTPLEEVRAPAPGTLIVLTTGTTGEPKAARYTWMRLLRQLQNVHQGGRRVWLLTYPLNHFAGLQMLLHTLANGHTLVIPPSRRFDDVVKTIRQYGVDSVSGTPTFWRMLVGRLKGLEAKLFPLRQITLGGEAPTPELLADLKRLFPAATVTQVYATTELGTCFAVKDGRAGFPRAFLERSVGNVRLKIVGDELYVQSKDMMLGFVGREGQAAETDAASFTATGDIVEVVGDRVFFRGRKSEIINVGGVKVHPGKVEETILQVDGVQAVRVFGKANPVTGQLVVAMVEPAVGLEHTKLIGAVREACGRNLNRFEQPREIRIEEQLAKRNGKIVRRQS